ncbi:hypothetical protein [Allorhodopirellula heiligendammensis]|uniref:Uncharacterized protein n=1 Tax=Allorhodopirellula heiligendammensis TaxID=2714739 RepID=A0A5C6BEN9_9BACT|nr:hypothetical protein [Allorhodopirellula heiligendammensis]TWU10518.1 hypothetical protein Poly21_44230 [Allorhodopirellula heiligendammensis]
MESFVTYSRDEFSNKLGLADYLESDQDNSVPSPWGIARLIRREVRRHGLATRRELRKAIEPFLIAAGFEGDANKAIHSVAVRMVDVGELADLKVENQRGYSAIPSRWIKLSDTDAVLLGTTATETHRFSSYHPNQFLRRFRPSDAIVTDLNRIGVSEQSFEDWLGEPSWKSLKDQKDGIGSLADLLEWQISQLDQEGSPLFINDTKILAINHRPGEFFGSERKPERTRWTSPSKLDDGIYLGAQPGRNEQHWIPILLRIDGSQGKSIMLNCRNDAIATYELRNWMLIAIGARNGQPELIDADNHDSEIQCTFPVPSQISTILSLTGEPTGRWQRYAVLDVRLTYQWLVRAVPELQIRHLN